MTNVVRNGMFDTFCAYCGKPLKAYAKNKMGDTPAVFCDKVCEGNARYEKKFVNGK